MCVGGRKNWWELAVEQLPPSPNGNLVSGVKVHWKPLLLSVIWIVAITTMCLGGQVAHKLLGGESPI